MFVVGTRPELIKVSPVLLEIKKRGLNHRLVHSEQHYDYNMSGIFFKELGLPDPDNSLNANSTTEFNQIGKGLIQLESILISKPPKIVIVHGDTNTALFSAIATTKLGIPLAHIESGLRSFDMTMPEEINRRVIDSISNYCFAPTKEAIRNLNNEGKKKESMFVGDTLVEIAKKIQKIAKNKSKILSILPIRPNNFILVTAHRKQNIDLKENALNITNALLEFKIPIVFPMHPRTKKNFSNFGILSKLKEKLIITEPLGYFDFITLINNAKLILTDSGGIQQEASVFNTPCVTLRNNTEWLETVESGKNKLVGTKTAEIIESANKILNDQTVYEGMCKSRSPYKIGASKRIVDHLEKVFLESTDIKNV